MIERGGGRTEGQEEINQFWKELKDTPPIQSLKDLAHSQHGEAGTTAVHKNRKGEEAPPHPFSQWVLKDFPHNLCEG